MPDPYQTLEVGREATPDAIQKAYRRLARRYHPDKNPDDEAAKKKFQEIQAAFDVLNDPEKRRLYDQYGDAYGPGGPGGSAGPQGPAGFDAFDFQDLFRQKGDATGFGDFFRQFTGASGSGRQRPAGGGRRAAPRRGRDIHHEINVPFRTAIQGGESRVTIRRENGQLSRLGVRIPAGIADGQKIRLRGQGEPQRGGKSGDLFIRVNIAAHPHFSRTGNRLDVVVPVSVAEAVCGAKVSIPAPQGTIELQVPAGTSSGTRLRVKGQGVAVAGRRPGDLYAVIQIVLPDGLREDDAERLAQTLSAYEDDPRRDLRW